MTKFSELPAKHPYQIEALVNTCVGNAQTIKDLYDSGDDDLDVGKLRRSARGLRNAARSLNSLSHQSAPEKDCSPGGTEPVPRQLHADIAELETLMCQLRDELDDTLHYLRDQQTQGELQQEDLDEFGEHVINLSCLGDDVKDVASKLDDFEADLARQLVIREHGEVPPLDEAALSLKRVAYTNLRHREPPTTQLDMF